MALVNLERKAEPKYENYYMYTLLMLFTIPNFTVVLSKSQDNVLHWSNRRWRHYIEQKSWQHLVRAPWKAGSGNWFVHPLSWQHHIFHRVRLGSAYCMHSGPCRNKQTSHLLLRPSFVVGFYENYYKAPFVCLLNCNITTVCLKLP